MASRIRIGIVGATVTPGGSGWGANAHIPALRTLPDYEVVAVCTAHEDTAKASAEAFGVSKAYHDIDAMAADPEVDLVVVSVRVPLHRDLVMAGLRARKPVFCEWPLGANLAEAQEMADFARAQGVRGIVGLQGRSDPHVRYARDLVAAGEIGEVLTANLSVMSAAALERGAGRIWQNDKRKHADDRRWPRHRRHVRGPRRVRGGVRSSCHAHHGVEGHRQGHHGDRRLTGQHQHRRTHAERGRGRGAGGRCARGGEREPSRGLRS